MMQRLDEHEAQFGLAPEKTQSLEELPEGQKNLNPDGSVDEERCPECGGLKGQCGHPPELNELMAENQQLEQAAQAPAETGAEMPAAEPAPAEMPMEQPPMPVGPAPEPEIPDRLQPPGPGEGQLHNQWEIKQEGPSPEEMQAMMAQQGAPPPGGPPQPGIQMAAKSIHGELKNRA
jgi:hypothetical protein